MNIKKKLKNRIFNKFYKFGYIDFNLYKEKNRFNNSVFGWMIKACNNEELHENYELVYICDLYILTFVDKLKPENVIIIKELLLSGDKQNQILAASMLYGLEINNK